MIIVTGASGQLGRLVIESLLASVPADRIVAAVRNPDRVADLAAKGVQVRTADYDRPDTLKAAFSGAEKVLLISSNELGRRFPQHRAVIDAAKESGVGLLAYTSILHADTSPLGLAAEHLETEMALKESGVSFAVLRNGWYTENYLASVPSAIQHGALLGSAGTGRIASAARADYAAAAAAVLTRPDQAGKIYELAGDEAYTLSDFAAEIARSAAKPVAYTNLPKDEFKAVLLNAGLPEPLAELLADSDVGASRGGLFDDSRTLSALIGRPTTPFASQIAAAV